MTLLQIVPRLPPNIDGIGDHALRLAEALNRNHGIRSSFLVCDPDWSGPEQIDGFKVSRLNRRVSEALPGQIERSLAECDPNASAVLVHFAPYGYQVRGCPVWLVSGLQRWTKRSAIPILTMFHELEAGLGYPWQSAFWLRNLQRSLIQKLADLSSKRFTNTELHRSKLQAWHITGVSFLPSFSTVGEPTLNRPLSVRRKQIVVFGRSWQRDRAYSRGAKALKYACDLVGAERIIDIGDQITNTDRESIGGIPLLRCGRLPATEIGSWMQDSVGSFVYYPDALLTKSSIYAAACAHGTIPFVDSDSSTFLRVPDLIEGKDYLSVTGTTRELGFEDLQFLSTTVFERYRSRNSDFAAGQVASSLRLLSGD